MPPFAPATFERTPSAASQHTVDLGAALDSEAGSTFIVMLLWLAFISFLRTASSGSAAEPQLSERSRPPIDLGVDLKHESRRLWRSSFFHLMA